MTDQQIKMIIMNTFNGYTSLIVVPQMNMHTPVYRKIKSVVEELAVDSFLNKFHFKTQLIEYTPAGGSIHFVVVRNWFDEEPLKGLKYDFSYLLNPTVIDHLKQKSILDSLYT